MLAQPLKATGVKTTGEDNVCPVIKNCKGKNDR